MIHQVLAHNVNQDIHPFYFAKDYQNYVLPIAYCNREEQI